MKKTKSWKWLLIIIVLIAAAYQLQPGSYPHPESYQAQNFPTFQQPDNISCGPSCLVMTLQWYKKPHTLDEIRKLTRTDFFTYKGEKIGGTTPEYMKIASDELGVPTSLKVLTIEQLKHYVSQGRFPCCVVRSGQRMWHWVIVIGYTKDTITISDPGWGCHQTFPTHIFESGWNFTTDMFGNDVSTPCPICGGKGRFEWLGPFGQCDACGGTGKTPDFWEILVELGESKGYIALVPN